MNIINFPVLKATNQSTFSLEMSMIVYFIIPAETSNIPKVVYMNFIHFLRTVT